MNEPRAITFSTDAVDALLQILGIMSDQLWSVGLEDAWGAGQGGAPGAAWDMERLMVLEYRLQSGDPGPESGTTVVTLDITDVALLLEGMAFTEVASADLPWVEMVRWTADFVTAELRQYWSEDLWRQLP